MGRKIRRVPLDFDWPLDRVWEGFLAPEPPPCPAGDQCFHGANANGALLSALGHAITTDRPHPWWLEMGWNLDNAEPVEGWDDLATGLGSRPSRGGFMGHDSIDAWSVVRGLREAAGLTDDWGTCSACDGVGHGGDPKWYEKWYDEHYTDPPSGEGWQLWETVSEGSPITPVFATAEELATHLSAPGYKWGAMSAMTYENALRFVQGPGWAPTMMSSNDGVIKDGANAVAEFDAAKQS